MINMFLFKVGDRVKLPLVEGNIITGYRQRFLVDSLNGKMFVGQDYFTNFATVVGFENCLDSLREIAICEWKDINNKQMRLSFDVNKLEFANIEQVSHRKHIPRSELKVGMKVIGDVSCSSCWKIDGVVAPAIITRVEHNGNKVWKTDLKGNNTFHFGDPDGSCSCNDLDRLYLYEELDIKQSSVTNKSFMSSVVEFFRNLTASSDDKLLKEMGLENPVGVPTETGLQLSAEINYKKNREEIVKIAQSMKDEQEKSKK